MAKEEDFYKPIKKHFEQQGYDVKAEVKDCDCVCIKGEEIVICEFKLSFNISLVFQGLDRQKIADNVYICIPRYKGRIGYRNFLKAKNLCSRLGLGLIIVNTTLKNPTCEEVLRPEETLVRKNKQKREKLLKEYNGRTFDLNTGGQNKKKINTAYREACIKILCILELEGKITSSELVSKYGFEKSVYTILYSNPLRFFEKTQERGVYIASDIGKKELEDKSNKKLVSYFRESLRG